MATLYITEFASGSSSIGTLHSEILPQPPVAEQHLNIAAGAVLSAAFNANTRAIRLMSDAACSFLIGGATVLATANSARLASGFPEYFGVQPGQFLSVITNS